MSRCAAHLITALFKNSVPLFKNNKVQPRHRERNLLHAGLQRVQDLGVGVIAHGVVEHPPGVHVGQIHRAGELTLERRAAVRDGVAFEEPGLGLDLVTGLADRDR